MKQSLLAVTIMLEIASLEEAEKTDKPHVKSHLRYEKQSAKVDICPNSGPFSHRHAIYSNFAANYICNIHVTFYEVKECEMYFLPAEKIKQTLQKLILFIFLPKSIIYRFFNQIYKA